MNINDFKWFQILQLQKMLQIKFCGILSRLGLPDSYGTWPSGGGSNPGQLGQKIRDMALPTNASWQTTGANAANNTGTCN